MAFLNDAAAFARNNLLGFSSVDDLLDEVNLNNITPGGFDLNERLLRKAAFTGDVKSNYALASFLIHADVDFASPADKHSFTHRKQDLLIEAHGIINQLKSLAPLSDSILKLEDLCRIEYLANLSRLDSEIISSDVIERGLEDAAEKRSAWIGDESAFEVTQHANAVYSLPSLDKVTSRIAANSVYLGYLALDISGENRSKAIERLLAKNENSYDTKNGKGILSKLAAMDLANNTHYVSKKLENAYYAGFIKEVSVSPEALSRALETRVRQSNLSAVSYATLFLSGSFPDDGHYETDVSRIDLDKAASILDSTNFIRENKELLDTDINSISGAQASEHKLISLYYQVKIAKRLANDKKLGSPSPMPAYIIKAVAAMASLDYEGNTEANRHDGRVEKSARLTAVNFYNKGYLTLNDLNLNDVGQWLSNNQYPHSDKLKMAAASALLKDTLNNDPEGAIDLLESVTNEDATLKQLALFELGRLNEEGVGVSRNLKSALSYYRESANLGLKEAQPHVERMINATASPSYQTRYEIDGMDSITSTVANYRTNKGSANPIASPT